MRTKTLENFFAELGYRESSGKYDNDNNPYYYGMYQLGKLALTEAGYYDIKKDKFTGKNGINSKKDFLNDPAAQEDAVRCFEQAQWKQLKNMCNKYYYNQKINGIQLTDSGLLAGAHLVGPSEVCKYLKSNGKYIPRDGNGTSVEEYIKNFAGYDISEITDSSTNKNFYKQFSLGTKDNLNTESNIKFSYKKTDTVKNPVKKSLLSEILDSNNIKLNQYEKILYESMLKSAANKDKESKAETKITGKTLKNMLDTQYQKLKDYTNKIYMESDAINKRFTGNIPKDYKNPHLENDRIFTKEEIDKMPRTEYQKNEKAIRYQRKTIGIPTKSQAEKTASKKGSGMVHVSGYTTSDGRKVGDYFRSYPRE